MGLFNRGSVSRRWAKNASEKKLEDAFYAVKDLSSRTKTQEADYQTLAREENRRFKKALKEQADYYKHADFSNRWFDENRWEKD